MTPAELRSLPASEAATLPTLLHALWLDTHGDWSAAHSLVDELETPDAARVHAYLHRKEGNHFNATYWYRRATRLTDQPVVPAVSLDDEWTALATHLLTP